MTPDIQTYLALFSILCLLALALCVIRLRRACRRRPLGKNVIQWRPEWCQSELEAARERIKR